MGNAKYQEAGKTTNQMKNDEPIIALGSHPEIFEDEDVGPSDDTEELLKIEKEDQEWLVLARDAYRTSEDYFDSSIRKKIERNLAHFAGRHAPGSKYYSDLYKFRAKGFRPKTRSVIRQNEAAMAVALFSTSEMADVQATNDADPVSVVSADINQKLLDYRLKNTIDWFVQAMGAYQDALTQGIVISHQSWDFKEVKEEEKLYDDDGNTVLDGETGEDAVGYRRTVIKDTPRIELRPIENVRFSPSADWDDPINTSAYIVDIIPMEIGDVKQLALQDKKTEIEWYPLKDKNLQAGLSEDYDPIRSQREGNRQDSKDQTHFYTDFDITWIHRNIIRKDGIDWLYYTLGIYQLLSKPIPLIKEYQWLKPGERPYVIGTAIIETHKIYPESLAGLSANLQQEANDINNQRRDNVQLVLNRRYYTKRSAQIDNKSLTRNIPGSVTEMNDPQTDVRIEKPSDVTQSSYQEQDRINMDFDELTGQFSNSSVGTNRQLNETVGGMELMAGSADAITEYQLRTFVSTWVEPVLKQIVQLEQRHETDQALLNMMGNKLKMWKRFGVDRINDRMIQGSMGIQINVGFGATNPKQRIDKLMLGLGGVLKFIPKMAARLDGDEVAKEVFGALGYEGADRFFPPIDPQNPPQMPKDPKIQVQELKNQLAMELEKMKQQGNLTEQNFEQMMKRLEYQFEMENSNLDRQMRREESDKSTGELIRQLMSKKVISMDNIKQRLGSDAMKQRGENQRFIAERKFAETTGGGRGL